MTGSFIKKIDGKIDNITDIILFEKNHGRCWGIFTGKKVNKLMLWDGVDNCTAIEGVKKSMILR